jgi:Ca2+-dependent lipid-binding protein
VGKNRQDPYVRIKSGKQIRAKTEIVDNTENPEWGEYHYVPVHSIHEDLVLEVMDWTSGSKDKSLGSTMLHMKDMIVERKGDNDAVYYEAITKKCDQEAPLFSSNSKIGILSYSAEFYPTMSLAPKPDEDDEDDEVSTAVAKKPWDPLPKYDLHQLPIRYTPDDLIDISSYSTGVLTVKIHEVKAAQVYECYCQLMVDSLSPQHRTNTLKGRILAINEKSDAFIKDSGFSRVAIELKPVNATEKDDNLLGYWYDSSEHIIHSIQQRARKRRLESNEPMDGSSILFLDEKDEGEWFNLINPVGGPGKIRLSFGFAPLSNYKINPDESLESKATWIEITRTSTDIIII